MSITVFEVCSLGDLIDRVTPREPDPVTGRWRDSGVYRGVADAEWTFLTSLDRLGGTSPPHTKTGLEEHILRNFIRHSRPHFIRAPENEWELLVAAQHHGLPTRLLDWTYSPLVAAHFATSEREGDVARVIWRLDWKKMHHAFSFPELALLIQDLDMLFGKAGHFTPWALFREELGQKAFACLIDPPSLDARIVAQSAAFTLCSDKTQSFDCFLAQYGLEDVLTKIVIPANGVQRIRDQLDLVGISERHLFPDLDGVAAEMRRYYS